MQVRELIGSRALLSIKGSYSHSQIDEYKILEVSPSGGFTKLMNIHGHKFWKPTTDISLVEVLKELEGYPTRASTARPESE